MKEIKLCSQDKCTSCLACLQSCAKGCISMITNERGFRYPKIDETKCVKCGLCVKACHQLDKNVIKYTPISVYAAWHKNNEIHAASSSGGVFTAIADTIIELGGVVFGASMSKDGCVRHICIENKEGLRELRGSKYVQSDIGDSYSKIKTFLRKKRIVLFVGSPCQVSGLYEFLNHRRYDNLYTCDFICHGVPSQKILNIYKKKIGAGSVHSIVTFRDNRVCGYRLTVDGISVSPIDDYYMRAFSRGLMFMESCYTCKYATPERVSDFTIGDFWGIGTQKPFYHHVPLGVSLLMVNTDLGKGLFEIFKKSIFFEERTLDEAIAGNHNLSKVSVSIGDRNEFYKDFENMNKWKLMKKYKLFPSIRDFMRPIKRIYKIYKMK